MHLRFFAVLFLGQLGLAASASSILRLRVGEILYCPGIHLESSQKPPVFVPLGKHCGRGGRPRLFNNL